MAKSKPNKTIEERRRRVAKILPILKKLYPNAKCSLNHANPLQLLVATILSAQCTDERVNQVTPLLFARYPSPSAFSKAKQSDIEKIIHSTGFFRAKAKKPDSVGIRAADRPRTTDSRDNQADPFTRCLAGSRDGRLDC